jgi:hypothetical protein
VLTKLTESHEQLKPSYLKECSKLPSPLSVNHDACEWMEGVGGFMKKALVVLCSCSEQLTRATTLPWYGMGLSPKFICFSAGVSQVTTI